MRYCKDQAFAGISNTCCFSLPGIPRGLKNILSSFSRKEDEVPATARKRLYKRFFGILWVSFLICISNGSFTYIDLYGYGLDTPGMRG